MSVDAPMDLPSIAIVGAGPSGFYVAEALLRALPDCRIHMMERLHSPHGLVRYGVAPDHQKLKQVALVFEEIARHPRLTLHAGVDIGTDLTLDELRGCSHAVVLTTGSPQARRLGVPGESLPQVFDSAAFVGWYNGHPDQVALAPNLAVERAVVVGHGNVSLDVARLLARAYDDLKITDIPGPMLRPFEARRVREVHLLGRGGPGKVKFTFKEFRQLVDLPNVRIRVPQAGHWTGEHWGEANAGGADALRVTQWLKAHAVLGAAVAAAPGFVDVNLWFDVAPLAFLGHPAGGQLRGVALRSTAATAATDATPVQLPCELAVTCVGYACHPMAGVPAYTDLGAVSHRAGQVLDGGGGEVPGLFVAGWAKRGPTGIIGTNRADGVETAASLIARWPELSVRGGGGSLGDLLARRAISPLNHADWQRLDSHEKTDGVLAGKPREKLLSMQAARDALQAAVAHV